MNTPNCGSAPSSRCGKIRRKVALTAPNYPLKTSCLHLPQKSSIRSRCHVGAQLWMMTTHKYRRVNTDYYRYQQKAPQSTSSSSSTRMTNSLILYPVQRKNSYPQWSWPPRNIWRMLSPATRICRSSAAPTTVSRSFKSKNPNIQSKTYLSSSRWSTKISPRNRRSRGGAKGEQSDRKMHWLGVLKLRRKRSSE